MKNSENNTKIDAEIPDFLNYPPSEDIYRQGKKEEDIDPENPTKLKENLNDNDSGKVNELDFEIINMGSDLDVPGAELDDDAEQVGNEDEENNYYSIRDDNYEDLEGNKEENDI